MVTVKDLINALERLDPNQVITVTISSDSPKYEEGLHFRDEGGRPESNPRDSDGFHFRED